MLNIDINVEIIYPNSNIDSYRPSLLDNAILIKIILHY